MRGLRGWFNAARERRIPATLLILGVAALVIAVGDPTDHAVAGTDDVTGRRTISEVPPIAYAAGVLIALLWALPRSTDPGRGP